MKIKSTIKKRRQGFYSNMTDNNKEIFFWNEDMFFAKGFSFLYGYLSRENNLDILEVRGRIHLGEELL